MLQRIRIIVVLRTSRGERGDSFVFGDGEVLRSVSSGYRAICSQLCDIGAALEVRRIWRAAVNALERCEAVQNHHFA